jgi:uncharacterized BrkB/YihY/UPF0761 family membrane protein
MAVDPAAPDKSNGSWTQRQRQRAQDSVERAQSWAESARNHSAPVDAALTLIGRIRLVQLSLVTGYVAMRFFILIFPLAYLLVAGIGLTTSSEEAQDAAQDVGVGGAVANSISEAAAGSSRGHWLALIVGLMATAWAGRGALNSMRIAHAEAWRLPIPKTGYTSFGGLPLAGIVVALLAYSTWVTHLREEGFSVVLVFLMHAAVLGAVWLGISWLLPRAAGTSWKDLLPGGILFAVAGPALNIAMTVYFTPKVARTAATYGALGVGVVLVTYLLVVAWLVALTAELNSGLFAWRQERRAASPGDE